MDQLLFVAVPYVALVLFFLGTIYRYRAETFSYSSLSSQFLENRQHFWGMVPFHYGILTVLAGHAIAFLVPSSILAWNTRPLRLYILEVSALAFGVMTLVGFLAILARRRSNSKLLRVTSKADWVLYALLLFQLASGVYVAVFHPWGSAWFATTASPYLWSLAKLSPQVDWVAALPWAVKLHILNAWLLIGFFPFTRLVHILVVPNPYLWRKRQVVRWNRDPRTARLVQR
ncbi:MAG: respiratory nitrate reductase subunit gamma [Deltaproteobacteria bacterium]|nr:respiratory nitrate reductase subunit gamma [Deltaproteobacteria bacterium]